MPKTIYRWLEFLDDFRNGSVVFEVVLHGDPKQRCVCVVVEGCCLYLELDWAWAAWVEDGIVCLGGVWD